ncbi:MAG: DEAD/DEAH box helicase [Geminicoccaceae bacterium]|nr:DEAD/DEAH box helicase [Geminicoccaceae bacterium]
MNETHTIRFEDLGLREEILRAVRESGYVEPTPIQARAIPEILARKDVIGIAQTGTGKTASFVLPMLQILSSGRGRARMPRSLILSPTRELATQTARNFEIYGKYLHLSMALLIGGVGMGAQERLLDKGVDVLIATPGRLLDWYERGKILLGGIEILVIDEADRMFDMGFLPDVERIVSLILGRRQTLLFSATMPPEVRRLADRFLVNPVEVQVARPATTAETVDDVVVEVGADEKKDALLEIIEREGITKAIVFCNRKRDIGAVMRHLQRAGLKVRDLHGDLEQSQRQATLDQFTRGEIDFLVATDVAARGLDITDMPAVINFDVPLNPEDYVHRIGRTGRAGRRGRAFTLAAPEEQRFLANIEKLTKRKIPRLARVGAREEEKGAGEPVPMRQPVPRPVEVGRRRRSAVAATAPRETSVVRSAQKTPSARKTGARSASAPQREAQVLAFGEHVPRFLANPVPVPMRKAS